MNRLKPIEDNCSTVSIVHVSRPGHEPTTKVFISKNDKLVTSFTLPKYDMSTIVNSHDEYCSQFQDDIYSEILNSKQGREILNNLKNEKTNEIINENLKLIGESIYNPHKSDHGKSSNLKKFIDDIIKCPLEGRSQHTNNMISFKSLGLTKKQIWQRFVFEGLVDKFMNKKLV